MKRSVVWGVVLVLSAAAVEAAPKPPKRAAAPVIAAEAVSVQIGEPVLVDQAAPTLKSWGPYRMPKVFCWPGGGIGLTFAVGEDVVEEQGKTSPLFVSTDDGATWKRSKFPHPHMNGMNPLLVPILDGEYYCLPASNGLKLDLKRLPKPVACFMSCNTPLGIYRLRDCPADVIRWFTDLEAVRWSPKTKSYTTEAVRWDHRDQLIFAHQRNYTQRVYMEVPPVRRGRELLHTDYWTMYLTAQGTVPKQGECSLMVSTDNARSWTRRSTLVTTQPGDCLQGEPCLALNRRGELVAVIRTDTEDIAHPMLLVHSKDDGYTWSQPQTLFDFGVFPQLLQLDNGVLVLSFGRPGVWVAFSLDGGHSWTRPRAILAGDIKNRFQHSCGYTSILALDKDSFLLAYSEFLRPNAKGQPAKAILARRISVKAG